MKIGTKGNVIGTDENVLCQPICVDVCNVCKHFMDSFLTPCLIDQSNFVEICSVVFV